MGLGLGYYPSKIVRRTLWVLRGTIHKWIERIGVHTRTSRTETNEQFFLLTFRYIKSSKRTQTS